MHFKTVCTCLTALMLAVLMLLAPMSVSAYAEGIDSDMTVPADIKVIPTDTGIVEAETSDCATDTAEGAEVSDDTSDTQEPETEIEEECTDDGISDGVPVEDEQTEDEDAAANTSAESSADASDDETGDDDEVQESTPEELTAPPLRSATSPSRFIGDEDVHMGKDAGYIHEIIVRRQGGNSTTISRHWVIVDGVKYPAFCIDASKSSTSGSSGGLEPSTDAGLLWILNNVPEDSDQDYAIKQQAIWAYLGQSFPISDLSAGARCSMSTE